MYLSKDREQAPKSSKKILYAALTGAACVGVATFYQMSQEESMNFDEFELEELSSPAEFALGQKFYNIAGRCNNFYQGASTAFLKG